MIASGTPYANGQMERSNRSITSILAKVTKSTKTWDDAICNVEYALNNSVNRATGKTPSELLFGVEQLGKHTEDLRKLLLMNDNNQIDLTRVRKEANDRIKSNNSYNQAQYDKRRKIPTTYNVEDYVIIKNVDVSAEVNKKFLIPKFKALYEIKKVSDSDRYVIKDIERFQLSQISYEGVCSPQNMRRWRNTTN